MSGPKKQPSDEPHDEEFFRKRRPQPGTGRLAIALGALEVELQGTDEALDAILGQRYGPWIQPAARSAQALRVRVAREDCDYFLPPVQAETTRVLLACDGDRIRYRSYRIAGWFDGLAGNGDLLLAHGSWEPVQRAIENYVRVAVAWQAASRGGALVHAASSVWRDRGYLFYGESGAGKSTLAAADRRGRVVSDDLSLVLPGPDGRLELVGSPFRGTYEGGPPVVGSFPLAAGFRLVQAPEASVERVPRPRGLAELVGNLPFVAEAFRRRPDLFARVEQAFTSIPLAHLRFRKDDSYWDAIAAAGF